MPTEPGPLSVLMVEDSEDDASLITRELRRQGYAPAVHRVETAVEFSAALDRRPWDLILADYRLPTFSGPEALAIMQQKGLDVAFILVSGFVGEEAAVALMKAGAHDFILKQSLVRLGAAVSRELGEVQVRRERRRAEAALALLAEMSELLLSGPSNYRLVLRRVARAAIPAFADLCVVYASDGQSPTGIVEVGHSDDTSAQALESLADRYSPGSREGEHPFAQVLHARQPRLISEVSDELMARLVDSDEDLERLRALNPRSVVVLPLLTGADPVGILIFASTRPGRYTHSDLPTAQALASRVALFTENARLSRAREEFISTVIHEIRTPIAVILTSVQLLQRTTPAQQLERLPEMLARLARQCRRLNKLVTDALEVSRLDLKKLDLHPRETELPALVEQVVKEFENVSKRHHIFVVRNEPVTAMIDPDRIEQVLSNLINNAVKYSPQGGDVEVASRVEGDEAVVSVSDHGIGIPDDHQGRVFERFYRAHSGTPYDHAASLGVGLYLSKEFIDRHGGRIWFQSREGVGSTFSFSLPLPAGKMEAQSS